MHTASIEGEGTGMPSEITCLPGGEKQAFHLFLLVSRKKGAWCLLVHTCEYTTKRRKINIFAYKEHDYEYIFVGNVKIKQDDFWNCNLDIWSNWPIPELYCNSHL